MCGGFCLRDCIGGWVSRWYLRGMYVGGETVKLE